LLTQEQLCRDLRIRFAIDDEPRDLQLALCKGRDVASVARTRTRSTLDVPTELSQLALGLIAIPERAKGVERCRGELELGDCPIEVGCLGQGATCEDA